MINNYQKKTKKSYDIYNIFFKVHSEKTNLFIIFNR